MKSRYQETQNPSTPLNGRTRSYRTHTRPREAAAAAMKVVLPSADVRRRRTRISAASNRRLAALAPDRLALAILLDGKWQPAVHSRLIRRVTWLGRGATGMADPGRRWSRTRGIVGVLGEAHGGCAVVVCFGHPASPPRSTLRNVTC